MDYSFIVNAKAASNWETEKNDNYNTADVISINKNYNGLLQNSNDDDCYRFNMTSNSEMYLRQHRTKTA